MISRSTGLTSLAAAAAVVLAVALTGSAHPSSASARPLQDAARPTRQARGGQDDVARMLEWWRARDRERREAILRGQDDAQRMLEAYRAERAAAAAAGGVAPSAGQLAPLRLPIDQDAGEPRFTPFTVAPELLNREEVLEAVQREYPAELRDSGVGGTVNVWFYIDEYGEVRSTLINESSGSEALDQAAMHVAMVLRFSPALLRDVRVPVWVGLPITFTAR